MYMICSVCSCCSRCRFRWCWLLSRIVGCIRVGVCCICLVWMLIVFWFWLMLCLYSSRCRFCVIRFSCFWFLVVVGMLMW